MIIKALKEHLKSFINNLLITKCHININEDEPPLKQANGVGAESHDSGSYSQHANDKLSCNLLY